MIDTVDSLYVLGGVFYTGKIIVNSSKRYLRYPAQIYEREGDAGKLCTICTLCYFTIKRSHSQRYWSAAL